MQPTILVSKQHYRRRQEWKTQGLCEEIERSELGKSAGGASADCFGRSICPRIDERTNRSAWCGRRKRLELGKRDGNAGQ